MKFTALLILAASLLSFSACDSSGSRSNETAGIAPASSNAQPARSEVESKSVSTMPAANVSDARTVAVSQPVSLDQADAANTASQAADRKIIRNANLTLEVASPSEVQPKIVSIAESHQGFVVTSEATQRNS